MSNKRKAIPENQFTVQIEGPSRPGGEMCINILQSGAFNLNGKLTKVLSGHEILVRFTPDYQHLLLTFGEGIRFPKSGSCKWKECAEELISAGIVLPARYAVWKTDTANHWQGDLLANPTRKPSGEHRTSKKK